MRSNQSIKRSLKEKIFHIKASMPMLAYTHIADIVKCSKSTVAYYLGADTKSIIRKKLCRKTFPKLHRFCYYPGKPSLGQKLNHNRLLRKCFRSYLYGRNRKGKYREGIMELKAKTKIFDLLNKLWPGMKNEKDVLQAVNQWTGEPLKYDNGKPIMTPYTRCKLTNEIISVKSGTCHADHVDGDRTNNTVDNFSAVIGWSNQAKGSAISYKDMADKFITILQNVRKYDKEVDELIKTRMEQNDKVE